VLAALALVHWAVRRGFFAGWWRRLPGLWFAPAYGAACAAAAACVPLGHRPFIYFQF
jgi:hypothetical protein